MPVSRPKDGQAEQSGKEAHHGARDGGRNVEPTETFEPSCFHKSRFTLYHKVNAVKHTSDTVCRCFAPPSTLGGKENMPTRSRG